MESAGGELIFQPKCQFRLWKIEKLTELSLALSWHLTDVINQNWSAASTLVSLQLFDVPPEARGLLHVQYKVSIKPLPISFYITLIIKKVMTIPGKNTSC